MTKPLTHPIVASAVADTLGFTVADLRGLGVSARDARAIAWLVTVDLTRTSYRELGRYYGRKHTTILKAVTRLQDLVRRDEWLRNARDACAEAARRRADG